MSVMVRCPQTFGHIVYITPIWCHPGEDGFPFCLVPLKVSSSFHLREFFLATVSSLRVYVL